MKLMHFADLHLDAPFRWAQVEAARARRQALRQTLERICELAVGRAADALCCGGDLYEQERFTPDTAEFLRTTFAGLAPLRVFIAPGGIMTGSGLRAFTGQVEWPANVHVFTEGRLTPAELADGFTLWGAAHRAPANTGNFLGDGFRVDRAGVHVALFHGSEQGGLAFQEEGKIPHAPFRAAEIPVARAPTMRCWGTSTPPGMRPRIPIPGILTLSPSGRRASGGRSC